MSSFDLFIVGIVVILEIRTECKLKRSDVSTIKLAYYPMSIRVQAIWCNKKVNFYISRIIK